MINLYKALPDTIEVQGRDFFINTDFRYWLLYYDLVQKGCTVMDLFFLFKEEVPAVDFSEEISDFFINENSTPRGKGSPEKLIDYIEDGEYIYASFMQAYGIDLIDTKMHWWKFKALLLGLPEDTIIKKIMGYRAYKKNGKSYEQAQEQLKRDWALPNKEIEESNEVFNKYLNGEISKEEYINFLNGEKENG